MSTLFSYMPYMPEIWYKFNVSTLKPAVQTGSKTFKNTKTEIEGHKKQSLRTVELMKRK